MAEQAPWDVDWSKAAPQTPAAGGMPWDVDWTANKPAPTLGHEAAAVAVSPVRGVAHLVGMGGDLADLGQAAADKVSGYLPDVPSPDEQSMFGRFLKFMREESAKTAEQMPGLAAGRGDLPGSYKPPTSAQIEGSIEGTAGPLPEAKSGPGKFLSAIGEFGPAALITGGESLVPSLVRGAVLPGLGSEALGEKFAGTWLEPYARLTGALFGGAAGAAGSKATEAAANRVAAGKAATELGGDVTPAAVRHVAKNYEADALTPEAVAARQAALGPEAMTLDMGRQLQGRADAIASQPGKGQNTVLDAVEGRVHGYDQFGNANSEFGAGTAQRVGDTLDRVMGPSQDVVALRNSAAGTINGAIDRFLGPSPNIVASRNAINEATDQVAGPLYRQVMDAHPVVNVPENITSRPVVAQAMRDAESLARNHGENISGTREIRTELAGPGYHIAEDVNNPAQTSLRYWDYVKKALDSRISGMLKQGGIQDLNSADKADLGGLMAAKNALVTHLDNITGGAYGVARRASATKFQVGEAIDLGRSSLNTKLLPEELAEHMDGMSLPERAGVRLGMRREMQRIIDTAPDDAAAARQMLDTNQNRGKIAQVFGQPAATALDRWTGIHDALDVGRRALNTQQLPEELAQRMQGMSATELQLTRAGMRREIDRIIDTARNDGAAARRVLDTNQNREKIAQVFGQNAADEVDRRIAAETKFQTASNKIAGNSRTAVRAQLGKDTESPSVSQPPSATVLGLGHAALRRGQEYLGNLALERTREGIGNLLTRQGNDIPTLARVLSGYNTARAANAATPIGRQAGGLSRILAAQAPGFINGYLPDHRKPQ